MTEMSKNELGEVIFEFTQIGTIMRVTAVHVETGKEAVIQGPANYSQETLKQNALRKLRYVLEKEKR